MARTAHVQFILPEPHHCPAHQAQPPHRAVISLMLQAGVVAWVREVVPQPLPPQLPPAPWC